MDVLLRSLENESLLLMYLPGELPEEDRASSKPAGPSTADCARQLEALALRTKR